MLPSPSPLDDKLKAVRMQDAADIDVEDGKDGYKFMMISFRDLVAFGHIDDGDYLKVFLWEDLITMKPVAPMAQFIYEE